MMPEGRAEFSVSGRSRASAIAAAIGCISLCGIGLSLSSPLIALVLASRGVPATIIGLNTAVGSVGSLIIVAFIPPLAAKVGLRALLLVTVACGGVSLALFPAFDSLTAWFVLRLIYGAAIGTLFSLSEYWITAAAEPARRGIIMGVYATVLSLGFAAGPGLLTLAGRASDTLFWIGASFFLIGAVPILLSGNVVPPLHGKAQGNAWTFILLAPVATFAAFVFGAIEQGSFSFLALYGEMVGMPTAQAAFLLTLFGLGNVVSQVPLGLLSDRMNRPLLLLICGAVSLVGGLLMPLSAGIPAAIMVIVFVTGGMVGGLYTVGLAHLAARFSGSDLATANAAVVMLYSLGMLSGAPLIGVVVDAVHPHGFAYAFSAFCAAYCLLVVASIALRRT